MAGGVTVAGVTALVFYWLEDTTVPGQLSLLSMMDQLNKSLISKQTACEYKILAKSILEALKNGETDEKFADATRKMVILR